VVQQLCGKVVSDEGEDVEVKFEKVEEAGVVAIEFCP
jgi:hypothetical protein